MSGIEDFPDSRAFRDEIRERIRKAMKAAGVENVDFTALTRPITFFRHVNFRRVEPMSEEALIDNVLHGDGWFYEVERDAGGNVTSMYQLIPVREQGDEAAQAEPASGWWCPCGHGSDDICLNGLIYGNCGNDSCGGGCDPDAGTCQSLPGCCETRGYSAP